jgi:hypothetical protein
MQNISLFGIVTMNPSCLYNKQILTKKLMNNKKNFLLVPWFLMRNLSFECFSLFLILMELRAYTLSLSTSPFFVMGIFEIGS